MSKTSISRRSNQTLNSDSSRSRFSTTKNANPLPMFNSYMSLFDVQDKLKRGEVIEGVIRINPKTYEDAYISAPDGGMDIFIGGQRDRNCALNGDIVAALIKPPQDWKILYPQLETYLEEHLDLKELVYKAVDSNICHSVEHKANVDLSFASKNDTNSETINPINSFKTNETESSTTPTNSNSKIKKRRGTRKRVKSGTHTEAEELQIASDSIECGAVAPHKLECCDSSDYESDSSVVIETEELLPCEYSEDCGPSDICALNKSEPSVSVSPCSSSLGTHFEELNLKCTPQTVPEDKSKPDSSVSKNKKRGHSNVKSKKCDLTIDQVMRLSNWHSFVQKTARIVYIFKKIHSRLAAGNLKMFNDNNPHMALFCPNDSRIPRIKIQMMNCPQDFRMQPQTYEKLILLARVTEWNEPRFAFGQLIRSIGFEGDVNAEIEAMLLENDIDYSEFPPDVLKDLPKVPWCIPKEEFKVRKDLRSSLIFTIDPSTARDLDDAVSCLVLPSGNFRVGVHIADVSHFVKAKTALDEFAARRANSVYLPHTVIPMLPRTLSESLCSLNPNEDKLAFSVIWELTPTCKIVGEWFGKTIIKSCVKLSYDHAQNLIEMPVDDVDHQCFPEVKNGFRIKEVAKVVKNLYELSLVLRKKRMQSGALKLDQPKLMFSLDDNMKYPNGVKMYEVKDSNKLIEEFMLLANISVANKITKAFRNLALLRRHPPPHSIAMQSSLKTLCENGIYLDPSTSLTLSKSIQKYAGSDPASMARMQMIVSLCSKPMQLAQYFCAGISQDASNFHHYALNVPIYTHFTSPIRRYPDVLVHRMLAAAIDKDIYPLPSYNTLEIASKALNCNTKKQVAKIVSEQSNELFLALLIRHVGEMIEEAIVVQVLDKAVDVLVLKLGVIKRCYMDKLPLSSIEFFREKSTLFIEWNENKSENIPCLSQKLSCFQMVTVSLRPFDNGMLKFNAFLLRPT